MYNTGLDNQLDQWRRGVVDAATVGDAIDDGLPDQLDRIATRAENAPWGAFVDIVVLTSFLNAAVAERSSIMEKVAKHVEKVHDALKKIADALGAESFTISVSMPVGLSVSVTFKV